MIHHWHPVKIVLLWILDIALLVVLWKPCDTDYIFGFSMNECFYSHNILLWLALSFPVFVITWRWASSRERQPSRDAIDKADALQSASSEPAGSRTTDPIAPSLIEASPDLARAVVLQSHKDRKVLRIKIFDGREMDVAVRYEMHPFHSEHLGPSFMAVRYPTEKGKRWVWERIKYSDIAALGIRDQKYDFRLRLEDHYKRITESKIYKQLGLMMAGALLVVLCSGFAAMLLAILVSDHLQVASYKTAFWWLAGTIAAFFFLWMLRPGGILLEPDAPMEGEARAFIGSLFYGGILGSGYLFVFGLFLFRHTIQTLGWTVVLMMAIAAYLSVPKNIQDRFFAAWRKAISTGLGKMSILLLAGLFIFFFGHYLNDLGERYNHVLRTMVNLPVQDNSSK
ncbi:hypothetical protein [Nitrospira moscoviensis]|uniref:Uncharacterized protein n=1 Tax=Nitrospira moscoviensis TaxID=42253 RepID=A0A0K2G8J5_NITMO|nr:hypothetical protein [Nitrospira moscoviensis]ALA57265.1 membrane protein of unknown function [Nitrospira moscoviensis]